MKTTLAITGLVLSAMLAVPITGYAAAPDDTEMDSSSSSMDSSSSTSSMDRSQSAASQPSTSTMDRSQATASQPSTFVKDSAITTKIKAKLASEHLASLTSIQVDTDKNGIVWLSGTAKTQAEADKAVTIAKNTEGVVTVKNNLKVKTPA